METYFDESLIPAYNGTNFVVEKVTKYKSAEETYTMSMFKYKADVLHSRYNHESPSAKYLGDCASCGWNENTYDDVTWGDVLYLGLYLGCTPEYIYSNKSITSIDVIEADQEIIDYVTWMSNAINVIQHDEWTYSTSKKYDVIICDLWAMPQDVTQDQKTNLLNNYTNNLKDGGKIILPQSQEILN
jgi:hypothetical protein